MRIAIPVGIVAVAAIAWGLVVVGGDTETGRVIAAIGVVLLWVPLREGMRRASARRDRGRDPGA
ncbi:hypothetical protein [Clavibacter sp. VKM Ac-2542]|uniref:hypothetical protein n=1 Tax=Clavibacter TaxID=1573 RepID=UPI00188C25E6|nr:hypothetical protein [Clavibacter sp. VKM Ac-2542]MBF4620257.1 hypothetical protein [Clavibacter sp. VKM Ac-2542]